MTWWNNEERIIELNGELELANFRVAQIAPERAGLSTIPNELDPNFLAAEIVALRARKLKVAAEIAAMHQDWEPFRQEVLNQRRVVVLGNFFENFETDQGQRYYNATVASIDDTGVSIRHSSGSARLRCEDLTTDEQTFFGLDQNFAAIALQIERERRIAYENWVGENLAVAEKKEAELAKIRKREDDKRTLARITAARNNRSTALSSSIGGLGETSRVSSSYRRYSSYRYSSYRRPRTNYVYYYNRSQPYCLPYGQSFYFNRSVSSPVISPPGCHSSNPFAP